MELSTCASYNNWSTFTSQHLYHVCVQRASFFSLDSYHTLIGSVDENVSFDQNPTLSVSLFLEPSFKPISLFEFEMNHWVLPLVSKCNSFLVLPSQHSFLFLVLWVGLVKSGSLWSDFEMSSLGWDLQWVLCLVTERSSFLFFQVSCAFSLSYIGDKWRF